MNLQARMIDAVIAAIYARYSTDLQHESSIEDQVGMCERFAASSGWSLGDEHIFCDRARSGATLHKRHGIQALMAAAQRREFTVLIVENLSRLSRDNADMQALFKRLKAYGVTIYEASSAQKVSSLDAGLKGIIAQAQREQTADMVRRGMEGIVRAGRSAGGKIFGYRSLPKLMSTSAPKGGELEIVEEEAAVVREIWTRYADGESPADIAGDLNRRGVKAPRGEHWNASTITGERKRGSGILNNERYVGVSVWKKNEMALHLDTGNRISTPKSPEEWVRVDVPHLRIVAPHLHERVRARQRQLASPDRKGGNKASRVFSGLLVCGSCGGKIVVKGRDHRSGRVRVQCSRKKENRGCPDPRSYNVDEIEARVLAKLRAELAQPDLIREFIDAYAAEMNRLAKSSGPTARTELEEMITAADAEIRRLTRWFIDGTGDTAEIEAAIDRQNRRKKELQSRLVGMAAAHPVSLHPASMERYLGAVEELHEVIGGSGTSEPAKVIREVIEAIVVTPAGTSNNRHTTPPVIEVRGYLDRLLGLETLTLVPVGVSSGSGGGT